MPSIVLGVGGGIAAYKSCEVLRRLTEGGHRVRVIPTASALRFVGASTFEALSGQRVSTEVWDDVDQVAHVHIGQGADLVLVAPATADLLSRAATGRADDLLTATLLTARCPVVMAPAMHTEMWEHPAVQANVATLRSRGVVVVDPAVGRLTGRDSGAGRLPDPADLVAVALAVLSLGHIERDLDGRHVVVSSGGTREAIDPVRWIGNRSSGRQGHAIARAARLRGARVTLVATPGTPEAPAGVDLVPVTSADQLHQAVTVAAKDADVVVMAAAVADFRVAGGPVDRKVKKSDDGSSPTIALERTTDTLAKLGAGHRDGQVLVGFAAETDDVLAHGAAKLARKGADLLVVNRVGAEDETGTGFDTDDNAATILGADGSSVEVPRTSKDLLAHALLDAVVARL
jgi:phosphopantothenoylcysteine decarboxylase/phosphopantothenate--cysteine ligase